MVLVYKYTVCPDCDRNPYCRRLTAPNSHIVLGIIRTGRCSDTTIPSRVKMH